MQARNYDPALKYGATLATNDYGDATVTGAKTSFSKFYGTVAVSMGLGATSIFASAPGAGTITGYFISPAAVVTAGTAALFSTTAGTVATIVYGTAVGLLAGTSIINAAFAAGDAVTVTTGAGSGTAYITFVSAA